MSKSLQYAQNPHGAKKPPTDIKILQSKPIDERLRLQWENANGCPISDESKVSFDIHHTHKGKPCTYHIGDVRIWRRDRIQDTPSESIALEFFFDGPELQDEATFMRSFESKLEIVLKEKRMKNKTSKEQLTVNKRNVAKTVGDPFDDAMEMREVSLVEEEFPDTKLKVEAFREAGCMLHFVVVQTTVNIHASETLGQMVFPEHFPVDGLVYVEPYVSWNQMPRWYWILVFLLGVTIFFTLAAWTKAFLHSDFYTRGESDAPDFGRQEG